MRSSTALSSSALNYLESLDESSKALRNNKTSSKVGTSATSSAKPRKESISEIISKFRKQTSLTRTDSDETDFLNESFKSSIFDEESSRGEKVILFNYDSDDDKDSQNTRILPIGKPGMQVGKKSLKEIRELRNSIDQSLVKTPEVVKKNVWKKENTSDEQNKKQQFEPIEEEKFDEAKETVKVVAKSPFKKQVLSESSDAESIVFDEVFENIPESKKTPSPVFNKEEIKNDKSEKKLKKKKETTPEVSSSSSESTASSSTSSDSSTSDSESDSESESESESSSEKSSSKTDISESKKSSKSSLSEPESSDATVKSIISSKANKPKNKSSPKEALKRVEEIPPTEPTETKILRSRKSVKQKFNERRLYSMERSSESKSSSESSSFGSYDEEAKNRERRRRTLSRDSATCSSNVHNMMKTLVETQMKLLNDFNKFEYESLCNWESVLKRLDKFDGPNSEKLRDIIERRMHKNYDLFNAL